MADFLMSYARSDEIFGDFRRAVSMKNPNQYDSLAKNLKKKFPLVNVHYYGSRMMGVGTSDSDIDIFVEFENCFYAGLSKSKAIHYIQLLEKKLLQNSRAWRSVTTNTKAPVPFIRATFVPLDMLCDITVSSGQAAQNTQLLRHLFDIQPEAAKFAIFMKKWFKLCDFSFKNYNIVLLTIFVLQRRRYLPSIELVNRLCSRKIEINGHEVQFDERLKLSDYNCFLLRDFVTCLEEFFTLYRFMLYDEMFISPHTGRLQKINRDHPDPEWHKPMIMGGPTLQNKNQTYNISRRKLEEFKNFCDYSTRSVDNWHEPFVARFF